MSIEMLTAMSQIAKFMGPAWGPLGSYRPQMGPMLAPWTWLSGVSLTLFCFVSRDTVLTPYFVLNWCADIHSSSQWPILLTHLPLDKMATTFTDDMLKRIFLNEDIIISIQFSLKFVPIRVQLTISQPWLDNGLAPNRRQAIIWNNADPSYRRIYAALGGDKCFANLV